MSGTGLEATGLEAAGPLRVGRIDFANCTPLFLALESLRPQGVEFVAGVPTALNRELRRGRVQLSPSSCVEYLEHPELYGFLPDLSISSIGTVMSVLLFSRVPLDQLQGRTVTLTPDSATSVILLKILLEKYHGVQPRYGGVGEAADAELCIGDQALREARGGLYPHIYDLGQLWFEATGTPFVFALWICRRDAFAASREHIRSFYRQLLRARQLAYRSYAGYVDRCPVADWLGRETLLAYWQTISYDLTAWHLQGLEQFSRDAQELSLLPHRPALEPLPVEG